LTLKVPPADLPGDWNSYSENTEKLHHIKKKMTFLVYSATEWPHHYNSQPESVAKAIVESARILCCNDGPKINSWMYLHQPPRDLQPGVITALWIGVLPLAREMLEQPQGSSEHHDSLHCLSGVPAARYCALEIAIRKGYNEMARLLIDNGWTMHARNCCDHLLSNAAWNGNAEAAKMLLDHGWDKKSNLTHALDRACSRGDPEIVQILLDRGAELNAGLKVAGNPLERAAYGGHYEVVHMLLNHGIHFRIYGFRALGDACREGHVEIARVLLEKGLTPDVFLDTPSGSAMSIAIRRGHKEIVRLLVDHGARVIEDDIKMALEKGYDDVAGWLIDPYVASLLDSNSVRRSGKQLAK